MKNVKVILKGGISRPLLLKRWGRWAAPVAISPGPFSMSFTVWIKKPMGAEGTGSPAVTARQGHGAGTAPASARAARAWALSSAAGGLSNVLLP